MIKLALTLTLQHATIPMNSYVCSKYHTNSDSHFSQTLMIIILRAPNATRSSCRTQCTRMVVNTVQPRDNHPRSIISAKRTSRVFGASLFFFLAVHQNYRDARPSDFSNHTQYGNYAYGLPLLVNFVCIVSSYHR